MCCPPGIVGWCLDASSLRWSPVRVRRNWTARWHATPQSTADRWSSPPAGRAPSCGLRRALRWKCPRRTCCRRCSRVRAIRGSHRTGLSSGRIDATGTVRSTIESCRRRFPAKKFSVVCFCCYPPAVSPRGVDHGKRPRVLFAGVVALLCYFVTSGPVVSCFTTSVTKRCVRVVRSRRSGWVRLFSVALHQNGLRWCDARSKNCCTPSESPTSTVVRDG